MPSTLAPVETNPLLKTLNPSVNGLLSQFVYAQTEQERALQLAIMRRNDLYYNGKQYLTLTNSGGYVDYKPVTSGDSLSPAYTKYGQIYDYVLNVMRGDIWKFIAVLGSRAPNVTAQARDPRDENHNSRRMTADRVANYLRFHWSMDEIQTLICLILAKYGTAFSYVRYVADERRFGKTSLPQLGMVDASGPGTYQCFNCGEETPENLALSINPSGPMCPRCANPLGPESLIPADPLPSLQNQQTLEYANGSVDLDIATAATVNRPWWIPKIENVPWLVYQFKEDKGRLAQALPEYANQMRNDSAAYPITSPMEAYTQQQLLSPTGLPHYALQTDASQALYTRLFLQNFAYEYMPSDQEGNIRGQLYEQFPDGVMITLVNNSLVRMEPRRLPAHWAECKATPTESGYSQAYFEDYIQGQDIINDGINMVIEAMERSTPITLAHPDAIDRDRLQRFAATPGEFLFTKPTAGMDLARMVYRLQAASVDPMTINVITFFIERLRENHGILPAIWGGADDPTARQTDVNRNQALQMLSTPWNAMRAFNARTLEHGAMELAANAFTDELHLAKGTSGVVETIHIPGIAKLTAGGWFYETDPNMPMTAGQRRDWVMRLMDQVGQNPELASFLGLSSPENLKRFQEAMGIDWIVPGVAERLRVLATIHDLLQSAPIQPPPPVDQFGMPVGPPPMPEPSIPFDPTFFNPALDLDVLKEWFMGDEGQEAQRTNPEGYENVLAWAHQVLDATKPAPQAPPPPRLSVSANLSDMLPGQEAAVLDQFGIPFAGGTAGPGGPEPLPPPPNPNQPPPSGPNGPSGQNVAPQSSMAPPSGDPRSPLPPGPLNAPPAGPQMPNLPPQ